MFEKIQVFLLNSTVWNQAQVQCPGIPGCPEEIELFQNLSYSAMLHVTKKHACDWHSPAQTVSSIAALHLFVYF